MSHAPLRRWLPALLVAVSLTLLPAAVQARPVDGGARTVSLHEQAVAFFGNLWHSLTSLWGKGGGSIDPNGTPAPTGETPNNGGGSIDPSGQPGDGGGSIDPNGLLGDSGPSIDPDGFAD
jgi:hypothetical protein